MPKPQPDSERSSPADREGACFDVAVVGGGIMGAATAWALARGNLSEESEGTGLDNAGLDNAGLDNAGLDNAGLDNARLNGSPFRTPCRTLLLDAFEPGHDNGSSHGDGRIVRFTYAEAVYIEMARRAYPLWARLERESGTTLLHKTGGWEYGPSTSPILAELVEGLDRSGIPYERLEADELQHRFPQFLPEPGSVAIYQKEGAVVHASKAVKALWQQAESAGAMTLTGRRVRKIEPEEGGVDLETVDRQGRVERHRAKAVVIAGGGWTRQLLAPLGLDLALRISRETVAYFPLRKGAPVDVRVGAMPTMIDYSHSHPFYVLPQTEIGGVKLGWHRTGPEIELAEPHSTALGGAPDPTISKRLREYVALRLPHLETEPIAASTCLYTNTPDYHFLLDHHPRYPNVILGTGFSGHGFKFAPVVGEILASMALQSPLSLDLTTFELGRFGGTPHSLLGPRKGA